MAVDKLIDSTIENACRTAEANAIRAKTGSTAQITYDWANSKGFADAIESIETGITPTGNIELAKQSGNDVTQYASASVRSASVSLNTPTVDANGLITASATVDTSGWIGSAPSSATKQLSTQAATAITPTESSQTAVESGVYTTGAISVNPISSTYVGSGITRRTSSDLTASGATVSVPSGYYSSTVTKSVSTATLPTSLSTSASGTRKMTVSRQTSTRYINIPAGYNASAAYYQISAVPNGSVTVGTPTINSSTGVVTGTASVSAGYVSGTPTSKTLQLTTQAAKTVTPTTADQTAVASGRYTTGAVTVKGDANLKAENIASGVTIFGVTGTHEGGGGESYTLSIECYGVGIIRYINSNNQYATYAPPPTGMSTLQIYDKIFSISVSPDHIIGTRDITQIEWHNYLWYQITGDSPYIGFA